MEKLGKTWITNIDSIDLNSQGRFCSESNPSQLSDRSDRPPDRLVDPKVPVVPFQLASVVGAAPHN